MDQQPDPADGEAVVDPNDLIVGTIRRPAWLGRIRPLAGRIRPVAWLFIALALLDVAYRLADRLPFPPNGVAPADLADLALTTVGGAAVVLLPAAILVGGPRLDGAGRWLFQGAVALAAAELVRLLGQDAFDRLIGPPSAGDQSGLMTRLVAVGLAARVLSVFGLAKLGLGLDALVPASRGAGRLLPIVVIGAFVLVVVETAISFQPFASTTPGTLQLVYVAVSVVGSLLSLGLWGWLAVVAGRRQGRSWSWVRAGGVGLVLAFGVSALGGLAALTRSGSPEALTILNWFGLAASACAALGSVALCVGLALSGRTDPFVLDPHPAGA